MKTKQDALNSMSGAKADIINDDLIKMEDFIYSQIIEHNESESKRLLEINIEIGVAGLSLWRSMKLKLADNIKNAE